MSDHLDAWEATLLRRAQDALSSQPVPVGRKVAAADLQRAYARCEEITTRNSRTFHLASGLLPAAKRRAMRALYAFCRKTDDLVDRLTGDAQARLAAWKRQALGQERETSDDVLPAWFDTQEAYGIPSGLSAQLIDGIGQDLVQARYATFADLTGYCYAVASTVGLMAMHIVGYSQPEALPYAVRLGVALQLTNILRDVREDWHAGRLYLPQDELAAFGLDERDVQAGRVDERWRGLMRFQIERVRQLYARALPGVALLHRDGRLAIGAAAELYRAILNDIESHGMDVFSRRAHVGTAAKLWRLPGIWWRARIAGYGARASR